MDKKDITVIFYFFESYLKFIYITKASKINSESGFEFLLSLHNHNFYFVLGVDFGVLQSLEKMFFKNMF